MELKEFISRLNQILTEKSAEKRGKMVSKFVDIALNEDESGIEEAHEILTDLALEIDYYVSNPEWRKEFSGYFGDEKLEEKIKAALDKIEKLKK